MKLRLRGKYTLIIVSLLTINIIVLSGLSVFQFKILSKDLTRVSSQLMSNGMMKEMEATGNELAALLADNLVNPLYHFDIDGMYEILSNYMSAHNVLSIRVYDTDGRVVHDGLKENENFGTIMEDDLAFKTMEQRKPLSIMRDNTMAMYYPINLEDTSLGGVRVIFSLQEMQNEILAMNNRLSGIAFFGLQKSIYITLCLSLAFILIGFAVAYLIASRISDPINRLAGFAARIGKGDYGFRMEAKSNDEIGDLIRAFDRMQENLRSSTVSIHELESQVSERTRDLEVANAALEKHQSNLEKTVSERTKELQLSKQRLEKEVEERKEIQLKLAHAQKMEAVGTLAAGVAHDLNNILSGIVGYPDLILSDLPKDSPMIEDITNIKKSGIKAAAIVQDLLSLARRSVSSNAVINLDKIVRGYINSPENASILKDHPDIVIHTHFEERVPNISGASVHLTKALMNLVYNAAESMPNGGTIDINLKKRKIDSPPGESNNFEKGYYAVLEVSDCGEGISKENLQRIFEPFFTTKTLGKSGSGLGLAVVWGVVQDHGGYIDVRSEIGKGTTFSLFFPAAKEETSRASLEEIARDIRGKGETVLIVDDLEAQRSLLSKILGKLGYITFTAHSGEEAVKFMRHNTADLLVLDMRMDPGIDGLETYRQIIRFRPGQRAIITSGYSENSSVKKVQEIGAGAYIRKPYTLKNIGQAVRLELDR